MTPQFLSSPCAVVDPKALRFLLVLLVTFGITQADAAPLNDWPSRQRLDVPAPGLVRVAVPPETHDAAQASLADLRLLDPAGAEVPYLIEQPRARTRTLRPQEGWQVFLEANRTRIEIDLNLRGQLTAFSLETPAPEFLKAASLTGTAEGVARALLTAYPVFRQPGGAARLQFKLPESAWTHLTLILDDARSKPIPITGILLHEEDSPTPPPEVVAVRLGERIENTSETRLTIDLGAARVPLAGLRFHTGEPLFVRRVNVLTRQWTNGEVRERSLGGGTIYRVAVEGQATAGQLDLALDVQPPTRELVLAIDNGDSPPLPVEAVDMLRRPTHLVFLARQAGTFQLFSGNPRATAPRYDVAALASQLKGANVALLKPGTLGANPDFRPSEPLPEIPLFGAALDVEAWSFRRAVKAAPGAVQQLELTPHVLAHAQIGLSDLRLVAAGKQVPFILERAGFTRALIPEVSRADDAKQPRLSRWTIRLPQTRLPITQLSCETKAALFQREARIFEEVADNRGERYPRMLGSASWLRRPESKSVRFSVALGAPPQTDTLLLEIDNGDNPSIELEKFQVSLPVNRILFKAPPEVPVELCYGNVKATGPSYDLDLVAPQILAAAKSEATLADADPAGPGQRRPSNRNLSLLFFGVLAFVVIGLILVITRLLPKQPNTT
jgi:hypothetical protein